MTVESFLNELIKKRIIVLGVLGVILVGALAGGYLYQSKIDKNNEASVIFDDAWQKIYAVVEDIQTQPNQMYDPGHENLLQAMTLYKESIADLEILLFEYGDTIAGARAALLVQKILPLDNLNLLLGDPIILETLKEGVESVKQKHPDFWGAVMAMSDGILAEQTFDFASALGFYQEALKLDKKNYLSDYIIISIARNNEILGNKNEAIEYYQQIEDKYPDSVWLSFAMGKVYLLSQ